MKTHHIITGLALTLLIFLSTGCSYITPQDSNKGVVAIRTIGVLPAEPVRHLPSDVKSMGELETGAEVITGLLAEYFDGYRDVSVISADELEGLSLAESASPLHLAREAGQKLNYDAILLTSVERYQSRDGSEYAVITPASVAFSQKLLAIKSGQVVWSGEFNQTQRALFENILSTRSSGSGFRWLSAAELARTGLNEKLQGCPYLKQN